MKNRRAFIKQLAVAGMAGSMPSVIFSQKKSEQPFCLLVRGDDMGKNYCRNRGFYKSFKEGILTSASVMATSAFFSEAVQFCKKNPLLAVGIHITLSDGTQRPVLSPEEIPGIINPKGFFYESYQELQNPGAEEMEKEIRAQVEKARASGLRFVYLDSHRSAPESVEKIIAGICREQKLIYGPTDVIAGMGYKRIDLMSHAEKWPTQVLPDGQKVYYSAPAFTEEEEKLFFEKLTNLEPGRYLTVIHPGWADPNRASVTKLLCSPRTREIIKQKNIRLVSYNDLSKEKFGISK